MTEPETIEGEVAEVLEQASASVDPQEAQNLPAVRQAEAIVARGEITVDEIVAQRDKIIEVMQRVMTDGVHYGKIPGVKNPTLLKPGAEAINVALRLAPHYESEKIWHDDGHLTVSVVCTLKHIPTDLTVATGEGLCSTKESKYAYRNAKRTCPECGVAAIIKGKAEYGGGWVCWKKNPDAPGCGANFADDDARITGQPEGKIPNPDLADTYNTVLKMADKRALVAAVLNGTAASDVFTQDVEDQPSASASPQPQPARQEGVQEFPVPKTWPEIEYTIKLADNPVEAWELFQAFMRAAVYHLWGIEPVDGKVDQEKLDKEQRMVLLQKASGASVWLHENVKHEGPFLFFDEAATRQAWAAMLDGALLEIPDYTPPEPEHPQIDPDLERERDSANDPYS